MHSSEYRETEKMRSKPCDRFPTHQRLTHAVRKIYSANALQRYAVERKIIYFLLVEVLSVCACHSVVFCEKIAIGHKHRDKGHNMYRHLIRDTILFDGSLESRHPSKENETKEAKQINTKSNRKENDDEGKCVLYSSLSLSFSRYLLYLIVSGNVFLLREKKNK